MSIESWGSRPRPARSAGPVLVSAYEVESVVLKPALQDQQGLKDVIVPLSLSRGQKAFLFGRPEVIENGIDCVSEGLAVCGVLCGRGLLLCFPIGKCGRRGTGGRVFRVRVPRATLRQGFPGRIVRENRIVWPARPTRNDTNGALRL